MPCGTWWRRAFPVPSARHARVCCVPPPATSESPVAGARSASDARWVLLVVPLLMIAACSGPSERSAVSETAAPPTPVAESPSPAATAPPSPSEAPTASRASERALDGDVDGDGEPDRIQVAGATLRVTLSGSGRLLTTSVDSDLDTSEPAGPAGSVDIDRDGRAEVFVRVGQGSSTTTLRPFRYDGKTLSPINTADAPLLLVVGGSTTHGNGFACTDSGQLRVASAESSDGSLYRVVATTYQLSGNTAVQVLQTRTAAKGMDDPRVAQAYRVDCGSVGEGE